MDEVKSNVKYQYLAGICVNIISLSYGAFCGWTSASFFVLQSNESPLETGPMSSDDAGWVGAMVCLGGAMGTLLFGWCADSLGRRRSLMLILIPTLIGWLIIPFARNPIHLCISRFIGGIAGGGAFSVIPLYLTEVAENKIRGVLGTFLIFSCNIGILIAFILGYFYTYATVAWIMAVFCSFFLLLFKFLPETPQHLIRTNKVNEAEKAFRYFRNIRTAVHEMPDNLKSELQKLKSDESLAYEDAGSKNSLTWQDFSTRIARKALLLGVFLMSVNQLSGLFAIINYTATIFEVSGSDLSPNMSAIIVGIVQIIGSYISTLLVDRTGRKVLLVSTGIGTALGHFSLATYTYLANIGYDVQSFSWVPIVSLSFTIFVACVGILPLPFLIVSEIMPPKIRNIGIMICTLCMWTFAFTLLKLLPFLLSFIGLSGMLVIFGGYCLVAAIFALFALPETKGKSFDAIMAML